MAAASEAAYIEAADFLRCGGPTRFKQVLSMERNDHDNRRRMFADVVSVDAWHDEFDYRKKRVDLHADVVFGTARLGGERESEITFRLSLRRAELVVIVPETEPVRIDRASISRDAPEMRVEKTMTRETTVATKAKAATSISVSQSGTSASLSGGVEGEANAVEKEKLEASETLRLMLVTQSTDEDGHCRWAVTPQTREVLDGRPWNAIKEPRLTLVDQRRDRLQGLPPTVRVEVRCLREDLIIEDIQPKDPTLLEKVQAKAGFGNRLKAAEAYIRNRLLEEGLEVGEIADKFAGLTLASVIAEAIEK
jgi:hypothetical protein